MTRIALLVACGVHLCGCGGYYILTVPDQLAPAGGDATAVIRLQRNDFFVMAFGVEDAPMRFRAGGGTERAAYTDDLGYAGTTVPAPERPGRYALSVALQDVEGEEIGAEAPMYVWDRGRDVIAVDLDCLPRKGSDRAPQAAAALRKLSERANILYFTRESVRRHKQLHARLEGGGYPDGPILLWQRQRWHIVRGRWNIPRIVIESRLVSQLPSLRKTFPRLEAGVGRCALSAKAFDEAGVRVVVVGDAKVNARDLTRRASWADLAEKGI
jgi:hypothetical protein